MKKANTIQRRNFLLAAGLGGAGVAAAVATATSKAKVVKAEAPAGDTATGYRSTPHIEKYYKTTKV